MIFAPVKFLRDLVHRLSSFLASAAGLDTHRRGHTLDSVTESSVFAFIVPATLAAIYQDWELADPKTAHPTLIGFLL